MEDWKNSDFWQRANQLYELREQHLRFFKQHLDNYAANIEKARNEGPDSPAAKLLEEAKQYIGNEYQLQYGCNIHLADFFLGKK